MNIKLRNWLSSTLIIACLMVSLPATVLANVTSDLQALNSGKHFAIMRHALAPGFSDPANFELRNCSTQRNLSKEGFEQAARIGQRFKASGINNAHIYTSQWCRCIDTANTLGLGEVKELAILNSFFETPSRRQPQTEALKAWLLEQDLSEPLVLVAHQVNMTALTGEYPASGEIFIVERTADGEFVVTDKIRTD